MECTDNCEGRVRTLPGMCTWGYRARTRAARAFKQSPCLVDERVTGAQRRNMNADAMVAQIQCIGDGGRRCLAGRCGGNARNGVFRLTTDMRTTQGQAAFGNNVLAIITYVFTVKTSCNRYRWTRLFNARRTHLLWSSKFHKSICYELF
jgi:hypothetical protein